MTTATRSAAAFRLAQDLAAEATNAAGYAEAMYRAIAPARAAFHDAETKYEEAKRDAEQCALLPRALARALAWPLGIVEETDTRAYDGPTTTLRAAFGRGRVTSSPVKYHGTPKGRSFGWIIRPDGSHGREAGETFEYEPAAGTNNPEKLAAQVRDAEDHLRAWLAGHTADAWLRAHGIDPEDRPPLVSLVAMTAGAIPSHSGGLRWYRPLWTMTLGGFEIARTDDRRSLLTPEEEHAHGYAGMDAVLGKPPDDEEGVTAYAVRHAERARAALLRRFSYEPEPA
jgi:hypothetical protein